LQALSCNLNALTQDQKVKEGQLEQASKQEAKLQASEAQVTELREQINKLKLEITKNATLVDKLQAEKESNERNHGQRTALVGMLETQLSEMSDKNADLNAKLEAALYDVRQKNDVIQSDLERIEKMEKDLADAKNEAQLAAEALAAAQKGADSKSSKMAEALQKELQNTKQQMARKSTAAQRLLQQREAECAELRKSNKALQHEVDKGSYSDRRIFELAAKQSDRESYQVSEIEVRDNIIDRLKEALLDRDGDLASAEKHAHEVESQIEELFRIRRREDVNIDYLKSIVVQYLSLPSGSTERARLLPVLATLLQFDAADYRTIEEGKNKVSWWDGSVVPKLIFAPSTGNTIAPAPSGSAEVSVSSASATATAKRTSLQF
jgi:chromosome segregation ATPase